MGKKSTGEIRILSFDGEVSFFCPECKKGLVMTKSLGGAMGLVNDTVSRIILGGSCSDCKKIYRLQLLLEDAEIIKPK